MSGAIHPAATRRLVPDIPGLPNTFHVLAAHALHDPRTTSDLLLILADGLTETAAASWKSCTGAKALNQLAEHFRAVAPDYAETELPQ